MFWPVSDSQSGTLFDKVWVVSLVASRERREHIRDHLPAVGIRHFEFFDATPADDASVAAAKPHVLQYPPCFRCGGLDCGRPDCNNFLTPQQVACVLTYRRLWRAVAEGPHERVLVVEDDVHFHHWTPRVLAWLEQQIAARLIPFSAAQTCLLRLGWALGPDHDADRTVEARVELRMANPCHAITRDFANALVSRAGPIDHTADVYQHRAAPRLGESLTIFPPIASELSFRGQIASTIHPKQAHVDFLRAAGREEEADAAAARLRRHVKKKSFRSLLISGHPRSGTGYAAALCRQLGVDVGHERAGSEGISSWMFAVDSDASPYALDEIASTRLALAWRWLVVPVRQLTDAAPSTIRENQYAPPSYAYRRQHVLKNLGVDLDLATSPLDKAVWSLTSWTRILMLQGPDLVFRIEDQSELLRSFLIDKGLAPPEAISVVLDTSPINANKKYKGVTYPKPESSASDWADLSEKTWAEINWYCETFGYAAPRRVPE